MSFARIAPRILTSTRRLAAINHQVGTPAFARTMASVPKTMKAVIIEKNGGTDVLQYKTDQPVPKPKDGEILVKNDFIGINFIDTYFRSGLYPVTEWPYILGREAEGTIVSSGGGDTLGMKEGDRVVWMDVHAYAEYTAVPAKKASKLPEEMPPKVAAAAYLQGLTALTLIRESHHVKKGDWVLVHAAAGGVGLWLCQLLKAVGANTIGTASTQEKVDLAKKAGATHMINYSHEDVKSKVMELTGGNGVIAVFDGVGKSTFDLSLECVARKGSMISFGNASGAPDPLTIARLSPKNVKLMRPTLFNYM